MTISLSPPPLQVPTEFAADKLKAAFFNTLINTLYQVWTAVYGLQTKVKIKTTDATVTGLLRIDLQTDKTVMIDAHIVARRTGGTLGANGDSAWYRLTGAYKNIAGTLTGVGTPSLVGGEDQAAWNVGFTSAGLSATVTVTGAAGNEITWEGTVSAYYVGA